MANTPDELDVGFRIVVHLDSDGTALLNKLDRKLDHIIQTQEIIMSQQDDIDQATAAIQADESRIATAVTAVQAEIADLQSQINAGQTVDLTNLKSAVDALETSTGSVEALETPPAPPTP